MHELSKCFVSVCRLQRTFLLLDAPDELDKPKELLEQIQSFVDAGCWVLVTGRNIPDIRGAVRAPREIAVLAMREDLIAYIHARFRDSEFFGAVSRDNEILDAIVEKSNGM